MTDSRTPPPDQPSDRPESAEPPLVVRSEDVLQGRREVHIQHNNEVYRLRVTQNGRLILTK